MTLGDLSLFTCERTGYEEEEEGGKIKRMAVPSTGSSALLLPTASQSMNSVRYEDNVRRSVTHRELSFTTTYWSERKRGSKLILS